MGDDGLRGGEVGLEVPVEVGDGERLGELCGEGELLELSGDWRGDCWGESCVEF